MKTGYNDHEYLDVYNVTDALYVRAVRLYGYLIKSYDFIKINEQITEVDIIKIF